MRPWGPALLIATSLSAHAIAANEDGDWDHDVPRLCSVIGRYDARPGLPSLLEQFEHMAFGHEFCLEEIDCEGEKLQRMDRPLEIILTISPDLSTSEKAVFLGRHQPALADTRRFLAGVHPHSVTITSDSVAPGASRIVLTFRRFDEFAEAAAGRPGDPDILVTEAFRTVAAMDVPCFAEPYFDAEGRLLHGVAYIATDLPPQMIDRCIREEALNSIGLFDDPESDTSLFDDAWGRERNEGAEADGFSERDWALAQLLYHPDIAVLQDRRDVMETLWSWADQACGEP